MNRTRQKAAMWVARRLDREDGDDQDFDAWRAADPANGAAFDRLWATAQDAALTEAMALNVQRRSVRRPGWTTIATLAGGLTACAVVLAVAWPQLQLMVVDPARFETAPGEIRTVALADGSRVTLDGATRLEARIGAHRREARLVTGEAFFDIAHDAARPFTISAPEGSARVLGTAFDLERGDGRLELSVHRGKVRLAPGGLIRRTTDLTAGQRAFAKDGRLSRPRAFDPSADDWRSGWLETDGVTLARLVERLNRASKTPIVIDDAALGRRRVAGRFRLDESEALVRNLALVHGFQVRKQAGSLVLSR
ncbi:FecR family protein [Caulobacter sp. UNC279MFTsu5.1]|uniref:FecR family protein n=1 Tax=Caulobacter sp. UNC279MFTsu5.1 TaxID=1502775 RepID=UPI00041D3906|nr:FecR domain-containing protein [Caulobacter sp. UNC279MFTsu5.1]SFJ86696.1 FecR family protein [Caulobacter sp. UNC279MFTsu5.1]